jgi:hypothetical protein
LWDDEDGFFYDALQARDGRRAVLRVRSVVGLLPLAATTTLGTQTIERMPYFAGHMRWFIVNKPELCTVVSAEHERGDGLGRLLSVVDEPKLRRLVARMLDEDEFLSPYGLRSMSRAHAEHPFTLQFGDVRASVDYEPGESRTGLFGGNSNWRGPVWFPINYLLIEALRRFARFYGDALTVEHPVGSGRQLPLDAVADDLADRLIALFLRGQDGWRPLLGDVERLQRDPLWRDLLPFPEYFHGDTGKGLGASHQTGWTGLVADLILERNRSTRRTGQSGKSG